MSFLIYVFVDLAREAGKSAPVVLPSLRFLCDMRLCIICKQKAIHKYRGIKYSRVEIKLETQHVPHCFNYA